MLRLILTRLVQLPLILAVIFAVTFTLVWIMPGSPLDKPEGKRPPREIEEAIKRQYNLDDPYKFAGEYLKGIFTRGDFGPSLQYRDQRVSGLIRDGLPVSASLGTLSLVIALALGLAAGIIGALRPGTVWDFGTLAIALLGVSLPTFVVGSMLLVLFTGALHWLPAGGWGRPSQMILPALTLSLGPAAYIARLIRLGLADVMNSDFIRTARAKGLSNRDALFRHALKVAFLPVLSFLGPAAAGTMTGSFVIEKVFSIPGLGGHFVNGVLNQDQMLLLGVVLVFSTMLVLFNLVVDVLYVTVDPRIELA